MAKRKAETISHVIKSAMDESKAEGRREAFSEAEEEFGLRGAEHANSFMGNAYAEAADWCRVQKEKQGSGSGKSGGGA
jgi:hypothetical protein